MNTCICILNSNVYFEKTSICISTLCIENLYKIKFDGIVLTVHLISNTITWKMSYHQNKTPQLELLLTAGKSFCAPFI